MAVASGKGICIVPIREYEEPIPHPDRARTDSLRAARWITPPIHVFSPIPPERPPPRQASIRALILHRRMNRFLCPTSRDVYSQPLENRNPLACRRAHSRGWIHRIHYFHKRASPTGPSGRGGNPHLPGICRRLPVHDYQRASVCTKPKSRCTRHPVVSATDTHFLVPTYRLQHERRFECQCSAHNRRISVELEHRQPLAVLPAGITPAGNRHQPLCPCDGRSPPGFPDPVSTAAGGQRSTRSDRPGLTRGRPRGGTNTPGFHDRVLSTP